MPTLNGAILYTISFSEMLIESNLHMNIYIQFPQLTRIQIIKSRFTDEKFMNHTFKTVYTVDSVNDTISIYIHELHISHRGKSYIKQKNHFKV